MIERPHVVVRSVAWWRVLATLLLMTSSMAFGTQPVLLLGWAVVMPWYFIWLLPLLVVAPRSWVWPALLPPAILVAIFQALWFAGPLSRFLSYASVVAYGTGVLSVVVARLYPRPAFGVAR